MIAPLKARIQQKYQAWLNRRLPKSQSITLSQRRIFIFPNVIGLIYLAFIALIFVTAVNYQNNLLFSLSALMISVFVTAIVVTYQNLSGLIIRAGISEDVFAGQHAQLHISFENPNRKTKDGFQVGLNKRHLMAVPAITDQTQVVVPYQTTGRGYLLVPKLLLTSRYPLGLISCWSWLRLEFKGLVYPSPMDMEFKTVLNADGNSDEFLLETPKAQNQSSGNDFLGYKKYQAGDAVRHIAWKQFAKTRQLFSKEFEQPSGSQQWLDWNALPGLDPELRLQILCGWVLRCHRENREFGLRLPHVTLPIAEGDVHMQLCLKELALFGVKPA